MRALVTGAAGFIGSRLAEALISDGHEVRALDCLTDYYDVSQKQENLREIAASSACEVLQADLRLANLRELLEDIDVVFHQAGQPGVRASWRSGFDAYVEHNIVATQRLLEAVRESTVRRFVFASSSSIYGNAPRYPTAEHELPAPHSPYGVTKLAAEHLCTVYARNWLVPTVALRYFTVYGPRQRPDMAIHRLVEASLDRSSFALYGDGSQIRDFTYVDDVVHANCLAAAADVRPGTVINISGNSTTTLAQVIHMVGELTGEVVEIEHHAQERGDVARTGGLIDRAEQMLGWRPRVSLRDGLARQIRWHQERRSAAHIEIPALGGARQIGDRTYG